MATFWLFVTAFLVFLIALVEGRWQWSVILYILTGVAWVGHESLVPEVTFRPAVYSRLTRSILVALVLTWPLMIVFAARRKLRALSSPHRYAVQWGVGVGEHGYKEFRRWKDAVTFAQAKNTPGNEVTIQDTANFQWDPLVRRATSIIYTVLPSGNIWKIKIKKGN
jgi:hypothetical protein